jgi:transposase
MAEAPDLTLRAIAAELAERGITVNYFAAWHFFEYEKINFKKACWRSAHDLSDVSPGCARSGRRLK